jgi:hypothetical protein
MVIQEGGSLSAFVRRDAVPAGLSACAQVGIKVAQALRFGDHLPGTLYYEDRQWKNVLNVLDVEFKEDTFLNVDARVGMFIIGYSISAAMVMNMVGKGSKYPFAYRDVDGDYLSGSSAYRLHVPAAKFWSVTLNDASNASGLDNDQPYPSIGSLDDLEYDSDGSVDAAGDVVEDTSRVGVEGTVSEMVRSYGLRRSRFRG